MRRWILLFLCIAVLFSVSLTAFAHSGKTDSSGGHTDHSTGEYHYHHGYSAHNHYDMNGDGIADCPYTFKDKTQYSSKIQSNNNTHNFNAKSDSAKAKNVPKQETSPVLSEGKQMSVLEIVIDYLWIAFFVLLGAYPFFMVSVLLFLILFYPILLVLRLFMKNCDGGDPYETAITVTVIVIFIILLCCLSPIIAKDLTNDINMLIAAVAFLLTVIFIISMYARSLMKENNDLTRKIIDYERKNSK